MDARIQAIMAKYDQPEAEVVKKMVDEIQPPPKTLEEWIDGRPAGLRDWPDPLHDDGELEFTVESVGLGSLQEIMTDLEKYAPLDIGLLEDVNRQIASLEERMQFYRQEMLSDAPEPEAYFTPSLMFLSPTSIKALKMDHPEEIINKKEKPKQKFGFSDEQSSIMKSVQYTTYPGFFPNEMTPLPGQLEAPQLLNRVTKTQHFNPAFRKIWKKLFLSEGSVAVLQDTFWWFFLDKFQTGNKSAQDGLFSRIADSFVALFFSVPGDHKDNFFRHYPDCLAQALYAAYCEVFPRSYNLFDDDFKTDLMNGVFEWVTGTRPPPRSWQKWNFKMLEPANIRELQDDRTESLKANMSFDLDAALEEVLPLGLKPGKRGTLAVPWSASKLGVSREHESHEIGPGPEFERVNFNILGRSPLVSHYLKMKELASTEQGPVKSVGRTEIVKPQPSAPTYQEVISDSKKKSKALNTNYQKILDDSTQESVKIQKRKRAALGKLEKLKRDLVLKNNDIKIISERLLDLMTQPDYASAGYATSARLQPPSEDES